MVQWWWLIVAVSVGFVFGFFLFSMMKVSSDTDRMWEGYYQKLREQEENELRTE